MWYKGIVTHTSSCSEYECEDAVWYTLCDGHSRLNSTPRATFTVTVTESYEVYETHSKETNCFGPTPTGTPGDWSNHFAASVILGHKNLHRQRGSGCVLSADPWDPPVALTTAGLLVPVVESSGVAAPSRTAVPMAEPRVVGAGPGDGVGSGGGGLGQSDPGQDGPGATNPLPNPPINNDPSADGSPSQSDPGTGSDPGNNLPPSSPQQ